MTDQIKQVHLPDRLDGLAQMAKRFAHIRDASERRLWRGVILAAIDGLIRDGVQPASIQAIVPWYAKEDK
ncbi:MAG: hypothetical protein HXY38_15025 [Chloroflexi bacterium]|nr:hypothetical protein [Chloroflexota bacterium]